MTKSVSDKKEETLKRNDDEYVVRGETTPLTNGAQTFPGNVYPHGSGGTQKHLPKQSLPFTRWRSLIWRGSRGCRAVAAWVGAAARAWQCPCRAAGCRRGTRSSRIRGRPALLREPGAVRGS